MKNNVQRVFVVLCSLAVMFAMNVSTLNAQVYFDEDFSGTTGTTPPSGWANIDSSSAQAGQIWEFDNPGSRTLNAPISDPAAILDSDNYGSGGSQDAILQSPAFDASSANNVILTFDHYFRDIFGSGYDVLAYNGTSWDTVISSTAGTSDPQSEQIDITSYVQGVSNAQVAFRYYGSYSWYWILDNVKVENQSCPDPTNVVLNNVTATGATLSWNYSGSGTDFNYLNIPQGNTPTGAGTMITADSINLSGLSPNTSYDFYVREVCGSNDTSAWVGPINYTTQCLSASLPYIEDFESGFPSCWSRNDSTEVVIDNNFQTNSTSFLRLNGLATPGGIATSQTIDVSGQPSVWVKFDISEGANNDPEPPADFLTVEYFDGTQYQTVVVYDASISTWQTDSFLVTTGLTNQFNVRFTSIGSGSNFDDWDIDNVEVYSGPSCVPPSGVTASNISTTGATVNWTPNGSGTDFDYQVVSAGSTPAPTGTIVNADSVVLNGLTPATDYDFYVREVCGNNDTSVWAGPFTFMTLCPQYTAPYFEDFDGEPSADPFSFTCWSIAGNEASEIELEDFTTYSGPNKVEFGDVDMAAGDTAILVSPEFSDLTDYDKRVQFYAAFEDGDQNSNVLYVGVMSNPNNSSSFVVLDTITTNLDDVYTQYTVNLDDSALIGNSKHIAIAAGASTSFDEIDLDDFNYEAIPTCFSVNNILASAISTTEIEVNWTPLTQTTATDFVIEYGPAGFTPGMGDSLITQNMNADTITGLMSGTSYEVYVSAVCGVGDTSFVEGPTTATTYFIAPYFEDFEGLSSTIEGGAFGNGWVDVSSTIFDWHSNTGSTGSSNTGPNGDHTTGSGIYVYSEASNGSTGDTAILESPFVDISSLNNAYLSFWYHRHGADYLTGYIDIWDGSSWTTIDSIVGETQTAESDPYLERELDLSSYSGDVKFRFWHIKDGFGADWAIDDVEIFNKPNDDIGVVGFIGDTVLCGDSNTTISVIIENFGLADQSGFDVTVDWTGSTTGSSSITYNGTLVAGTTDTVNIDTLNTIVGGTFSLEAYTTLSGDAVVSNDTAIVPTVTFTPLPATPSLPSMVSACNGTDTTLVVSSTTAEVVNWYDAGMNLLTSGDSASFTINQADTAYATVTPLVSNSVGPINYSVLGSGGAYSPFTPGLIFDVTQQSTIDSVTVFVTGAGDVHVNIEDNSGNPVGSTVVSVNPTTSDEEITIPVGITVPAGTGYEMNATGSTVSDLYRNSGGTSFPYVSQNGSVTITDGTLSGFYYFFYDWKVTEQGCESSPARVTFESNPIPTVSLGNDTSYCTGEVFNITLDAGNAGATYNWSDNSTNQTLAVDTAGTYWVEVTNAGGCVDTDTLVVTENSSPMVALGNDTAYCAGDAFSITLDAGNAGATYNWSDSSMNQTLVADTAGTYWVEVTNANGCLSTDTLEVTENAVPTVSLNDAEICADETSTLDAGAGFASYNWSTGETTQTITVSTDDTYDVTVTNAAGCEASASAVVTVNPLPVVDLGNDTSMSPGYTITLDAGSDGDTYNWNTGASTQTVDVEYGDVPAEFSVEVTSAEGCVSTDTIFIDANTGVRDLVKGSIKLYPNPTRGNAKLDMTLTEGGEMMIEVYSISGQLLDQVQYGASAGQQIVPVDMSDYENGMYIINVKLNDESISQFNVTKM